MGNEALARQRRFVETDQQAAQRISLSQQSIDKSLSQISDAMSGTYQATAGSGTPIFHTPVVDDRDHAAVAHATRYRERYGDGAVLSPLTWDDDSSTDVPPTPPYARSSASVSAIVRDERRLRSYGDASSSTASDTQLSKHLDTVVKVAHEMAGSTDTTLHAPSAPLSGTMTTTITRLPKPRPEFQAKYYPYKHELLPLLRKMARSTTPVLDMPPSLEGILSLENRLLEEGHDRVVFEDRLWKDDALRADFRFVVLPDAVLIASLSTVKNALQDYAKVIEVLVDLFPDVVPREELLLHCVQQWAAMPREGFAAGVGSSNLISSKDIEKQLFWHRNSTEFVRRLIHIFLSKAVFADMAHATQSNALRPYLAINDAIVDAMLFDELAFSSTCIQTIMRVTGGYDFKASNNRSVSLIVSQNDALRPVAVVMYPSLLPLPMHQPRARISPALFPTIMQIAFSSAINSEQLNELEVYLQAHASRNNSVSLLKCIAEAAALYGRVDILEEWNMVARLNLSSPRRVMRFLIRARPDIRHWILTQLGIKDDKERARLLQEADQATNIASRKGANYKDYFLVLDEQKDFIDNPDLTAPWASYWR